MQKLKRRRVLAAVILTGGFICLLILLSPLNNLPIFQAWTAQGVVKATVFCPDGMVLAPEKLQVDDARLWSDGVIRFRAVCENAQSSKTLTGRLMVDLTWQGWKNVAGGWSDE